MNGNRASSLRFRIKVKKLNLAFYGANFPPKIEKVLWKTSRPNIRSWLADFTLSKNAKCSGGTLFFLFLPLCSFVFPYVKRKTTTMAVRKKKKPHDILQKPYMTKPIQPSPTPVSLLKWNRISCFCFSLEMVLMKLYRFCLSPLPSHKLILLVAHTFPSWIPLLSSLVSSSSSSSSEIWLALVGHIVFFYLDLGTLFCGKKMLSQVGWLSQERELNWKRM